MNRLPLKAKVIIVGPPAVGKTTLVQTANGDTTSKA